MKHTKYDWQRRARTGLPEVVFAEGKSADQIRDIIEVHQARSEPLLLTRLTGAQFDMLSDLPLDIDRLGGTARLGHSAPPNDAPTIGIVTAGTSDLGVALEAQVSCEFLGLNTRLFQDLGVAGLWRLQDRISEIEKCPLLIAVAGMEGALFSVLAGLVAAPVIAVPSSVGYGVARDGQAALSSALASCAPGVLTVNIDNGFGAAAAAAKILASISRLPSDAAD